MNMIEKRKARAGQGGFTLIELLVVIAILAILAGAAIVGIGAMRDNAKKNSCKSEKDTVETGLEARELDGGIAAGSATVSDAISYGYLKKAKSADWSIAWTTTVGYVATPSGGGKYAGVTCS